MVRLSQASRARQEIARGFQARVLGEFPEQAEDSPIVLSWVEAAVYHKPEPQSGREGRVVIAVDVARFGSDKSVILRRRGMMVEEVRDYRGLDTMRLTGLIVDAITTWHPDQVVCTGGCRAPALPGGYRNHLFLLVGAGGLASCRGWGDGRKGIWGRGRDRLRELRHAYTE